MSIQVGRSLGVARTDVRIDFLVKSVAFYPQSRIVCSQRYAWETSPGLGVKTTRDLVKGLAY